MITYSAALSACGKGRQWQRARGFLENMRAQGLQANVFTYNATISATVRARKKRGSQRQRALGFFEDTRSQGPRASVTTYRATTSAC